VTRRARTVAAFTGVGLAVALALAFFVAPHASDEPDGLQKVAIDEGFADRESRHALAAGPAAGYEVDGIRDPAISTGVAGGIGVVVTFLVGTGVVMVVRRTHRTRAAAESPSAAPPA
jgi:cobalt/nickel transport system permease protein